MTAFIAMLLLAQTGRGLGYSYFPPMPRGTMHVSRPDIGVRVSPSSGDGPITVQIFLDGASVPVTAGPDGWYGYHPVAPLTPGPHHAVAMISSAGYSDFQTSSDFTVAADALDTLPAQTVEGIVAQNTINRLRQSIGLGPLAYDPTLGAAADSHARYDALHPTEPDPHMERPGATGFVGEDPLTRAQAYGFYDVGADEVIDFKLRAEENIADWMASLYHRLSLVNPGSHTMGYGLALDSGGEPVGVADLGSHAVANSIVVRYPADGATGVPTGWAGREHPDPLRLFPAASGPLGYTVTLGFSPAPRALTLGSYSLRSGDGSAVAVYHYSPENDDQLTDTVALIPTAPLQPGTTYRVDLRGTVDQGSGAQPYRYSWSFTTAREPWLTVTGKIWHTDAANNLTQVELTGQGFAPGIDVFLQGQKVPGLVVDSPTHLHFSAPAGFQGGAADLVVATPGGQEEAWAKFFDGSEGLSNSGHDWSSRWLVGGAGATTALQGADGAVLLPASLLEAMGWHTSSGTRVGRFLATAGGHDLTAVTGRPVAEVDGTPVKLTATPRQQGSSLYVPAGLVKAGAEALGLPLQISIDNGPWTVTLAGFTDVLGHWAQSAIVRLAGTGIISGYGDGTFRPQAALTRAAYLKLVVASLHTPGDTRSVSWLADTDGHWLQRQGYLAAAVAAGVLTRSDAPGGLFHPDDPVDRQTMATWAARAMGLEQTARQMTDSRSQLASRFVDASSVSDQAAPYVLLAAQAGLISGYAAPGGYRFQPADGATRAEAVTIINRLQTKLVP